MLFAYIKSAEEGEAWFEGAFVVLKDDLLGQIQILTDYFGCGLLFCFYHKFNYIIFTSNSNSLNLY